MPLYTVGRSNFTLSTSADSLTIVSSGYGLRIMLVDFKGLATSSSANEILMYRGTSVGSTAVSGAITPSRLSTASAAASFNVYSAFGSSTSSTAGDVVWRFGVNGNGGQDKFVALPGAEISMPSSGYMQFKASIGAGAITGNLLIEELSP